MVSHFFCTYQTLPFNVWPTIPRYAVLTPSASPLLLGVGTSKPLKKQRAFFPLSRRVIMPYSVISLYSLQEMNCIMKHKIHINAHAEMPFKAAVTPFLRGNNTKLLFSSHLHLLVAGGARGGMTKCAPRPPSFLTDHVLGSLSQVSLHLLGFYLSPSSIFFSHILCRNLLLDSNAPCLSIPFGRALFSQKTALSTNFRLSHFLCPQRCAQSSS